MLTIVTINLNNHSGLIRTHDSILRQSNKNFEWVVVDGGSSDDSLELVQSSSLNPVWLSEVDNGIYSAMNKGIALATKKHIIFLNSGDTFTCDDAVQYILDNIQQQYDIYMFGFVLQKKVRMPHCKYWVYYKMPTSHQAMIFNSTIFSNRRYDESLHYASDYDFIFSEIINGVSILRINCAIVENDPYSSDGVKVLNEYERVSARYLKNRYFIKTLHWIRLFFRAHKFLKSRISSCL
jgi:glycosyltransferase involved in cell wall biosynthesis